MIRASPLQFLPRSSYKLYDNQPQCVGSLWYTRFSAMCIAALLSPYSLMGHSGENPISVKKSLSQISNVTFAMTLHSDLVLDRETTLCFLFCYDTRFPPRKPHYSVVDLLKKEHPAQSASEEPTTLICFLSE